ncbi:hypothetical protein F5Y15DRAFT_52289 [Xylariaceae sp. FL0016]|nr:hypothetical protein F5Y15DRAFT_52289 [Xylariaceae sp. FL0016]
MPLQIPHPTVPLHFYRHLLREASYLPKLCRPWITERIHIAFRQRQHERSPAPYVKEASQRLRHLRSANTGNGERMLRLCYLATGRVGKRRRMLAAAHLTSHPAADTAELEDDLRSRKTPSGSSDATDVQRPPDWLDNWSVPKITAIATSQVTQQNSTWPTQMRKTIDPAKLLPTEDVWGRPLSPRLARNKLKKHWKKVIHQLMSPLPQGEWDQLAVLVRGKADAADLALPARRPVATSSSHHDIHAQELLRAETKTDWQSYIKRPARAVVRGSTRKMKSLTGDYDQDPRGYRSPVGVRVFSPRKLQRVYRQVWQASPVMSVNPRSSKWTATWGNHECTVSRPVTRELQLFKGVGTDGSLPKSKSR